MTLILRAFLIAAGAIAALFVSRDALNFGVLQTFVAITLIALLSLFAAFWTLRSRAGRGDSGLK
jgi:hypothetical protein